MSEFNTGLPSIRLIQSAIKDNKTIEIKVVNSEVFSGTVNWQDSDWISLTDNNNQHVVISRHHVIYFKIA